ncbi:MULTISPECIES: hypothetical protein [Sphingobacterium]|uniref:hypothetical protein n=1 Tax=Sphingobacterium TaxID=28453 RepID=UPI00258059DF|nr:MULTISPECIES: hypothetical protein [Sphingobacterium]
MNCKIRTFRLLRIKETGIVQLSGIDLEKNRSAKPKACVGKKILVGRSYLHYRHEWYQLLMVLILFTATLAGNTYSS